MSTLPAMTNRHFILTIMCTYHAYKLINIFLLCLADMSGTEFEKLIAAFRMKNLSFHSHFTAKSNDNYRYFIAYISIDI